MKPQKNRPWLRMIVAEAEAGGITATNNGSSAAPDNSSAAEEQASDPQEASSEDDPEEDPKARGSKAQVLADLARERDRRQDTEQQHAALKTEHEELTTKFSSAQEELEALKQENASLKDAAAEKQRHDDLAAALTAAKLPAEMAGRLQGNTAEELLEDAKKLSQALGFDRLPHDPSQGKGNANLKSQSLAEATRRKLGAK